MPKPFRNIHVQSLVSPPDLFFGFIVPRDRITTRRAPEWPTGFVSNLTFLFGCPSHSKTFMCNHWFLHLTLFLVSSYRKTFPWRIRGIMFSLDASGESGLKHQNVAHGRKMWSRCGRSTPPRVFTTASRRRFSPDVSGESGEKPTASQNQGNKLSTYVFV